MNRFRVAVSQKAANHARLILRWAKQNDPPTETFLAEVEAALARLSALPHSGHRYTPSPVDGTFRVLLRRSQYHIYYTIDDDLLEVTVLAIWYSARGVGPELD